MHLVRFSSGYSVCPDPRALIRGGAGQEVKFKTFFDLQSLRFHSCRNCFTSLKATFDTMNWDEKLIVNKGATNKITRVRTERTFKGDFVGTGIFEYIFSYHPKGDAARLDPNHPEYGTVTYTGLMHFKGTVDGSDPGEVVFIVSIFGCGEGEVGC